MTQRGQQNACVRGSIGLVLAGLLLIMPAGCSWLQRADGLAGVAPIPLSPLLRLPSSLTAATITYHNACGEPVSMPIGGPLVAALQQKMGRVFQRVILDPTLPAEGAIDAAVGIKQIDLAIPRRVKKSYPVTVTVGLDVAFLADDKAALWTKKIQSSGLGEVDVQEASCEVAGLDAVVKEAVDLVAEGAAKQASESIKIREYAVVQRSNGTGAAKAAAQAPAPLQTVPASPVGVPPVLPDALPEAPLSAAVPPAVNSTDDAQATLTFRAILRDDNRDHILQPDEPLTIELEVKNDGAAEVKGVEVIVGGTGALTAQLPPAIVIGDVSPGEIKRTSVTKPVSGVKELLRGELWLSLRSGSPLAQMPPIKKFSILVRPANAGEGQSLDDVDQVPKAAVLKQPKSVVIAIGISRFRDAQLSPMKFAARGAEVMAAYLQSIAGLSADRVRVLTDGHALKQDLAETFEEWLPKRIDPATVVYVYFSGRALVDSATGAVSLVPYDGNTASVGRVYSVRRLQESLAHLPIQRAILMVDASLEHAPGSDPVTGAAPVWETGAADSNTKMMWMIGNSRLQETHAFERGRHGLFTYQLLRGLQGPADLDRDGTIVAGELCAFARGEVARTTGEQFGGSQQPICLPGPGQGAMIRIHPIAKGHNPRPVVPVKKEAPVQGETPNALPSGVGPGQ